MTFLRRIELHSHISTENSISPKSKYFQNGCKKVTNSYSTLSHFWLNLFIEGRGVHNSFFIVSSLNEAVSGTGLTRGIAKIAQS